MRESIRAAGRVLGLTAGLIALPAAALADTVEEHGGAGVEVGVEITAPPTPSPTDEPSEEPTGGPTSPEEPTTPAEPSPTDTEPGQTPPPAETPAPGSGLGQTGFTGTPLLLGAAGLLVAGAAAVLAVRRRGAQQH